MQKAGRFTNGELTDGGNRLGHRTGGNQELLAAGFDRQGFCPIGLQGAT